jgi:CheY-like chemotaxis protein
MSKRILVIDNSPTIREVVSSILERGGYEVRAAAEGQQGLDAPALIGVLENAFAHLNLESARVATALEDEEPPSSPDAVAGDVILSGDLSLPIGAILQMLQVERQTGVLEVTRRLDPRSEPSVIRTWRSVAESGPPSIGGEVLITWRDGLIDLVQSRGTGDEFRLGRFVVEEGLVTPTEIDAILRGRNSDPPLGGPSGSAKPLLGDMLREAGRLSEDQLKVALLRQASELIYELLRWQTGSFEFRRQTQSNEAARARLSLPVASVVMEGFRRVDEWRAVETSLGNFESVLQREPMATEARGAPPLSRPETLVLDSIDGERTISQIISASHMSSFDVCRILAQLLETRVVRRRVTAER